MIFYFDIDGTLTQDQRIRSDADAEMVAAVRALEAQGHEVVLWTGGGTKYGKEMALRLGLSHLPVFGKPEVIVDNERDKWGKRFDTRTITPQEFLKGMKRGY